MIDKAPVIAALFDEWRTIEDLLAGLDDSQWQAPTALPEWNVQAVVSHMIGTESFLSGLQPPPADIDVATLPHVRNPIAVLNEQWVRALQDLTPDQMRERFRDVIASRRATLTDMSVADWNRESASPLGMVPYGRFMRLRIFDCWMHELDIRDAVGIPGEEGGDRGRLAFLDIHEALGYVIGKRGKAPDGSRIALELTGPLARTIGIAVDGRARVVDALPGEPTTAITMDSGLLVRLCGGRTTAADHTDEIQLAGDTEVGQRIVDNLAFVI